MKKKLLQIWNNPKIKWFIYFLIYYFFIIYICLIINNFKENKIIVVEGKLEHIDAIYDQPIEVSLNNNISF